MITIKAEKVYSETSPLLRTCSIKCYNTVIMCAVYKLYAGFKPTE